LSIRRSKFRECWDPSQRAKTSSYSPGEKGKPQLLGGTLLIRRRIRERGIHYRSGKAQESAGKKRNRLRTVVDLQEKSTSSLRQVLLPHGRPREMFIRYQPTDEKSGVSKIRRIGKKELQDSISCLMDW